MTTYANPYTEINFWEGDTVVLQHPSGGMTKDDRFLIVKVNPKNLRVKHITSGKTYNGPHTIWKKVTTTVEDLATLQAVEEKEKTSGYDFSQFTPGTVVELAPGAKKHAKWNYPHGQKFVVIKHNNKLVNIVRLGGEGTRYWRMNPQNLVIVDM